MLDRYEMSARSVSYMPPGWLRERKSIFFNPSLESEQGAEMTHVTILCSFVSTISVLIVALS